ncbi:MAG: FliI/YscN family ATPase [Alicyclobacillus sp.]|nr:FliI/YscN family ATPase [Alicyclobacillus sp.]
MTNDLERWSDHLEQRLRTVRWFRMYGRVSQVVGQTIESRGPAASLGDICAIQSGEGNPCLAEVVGFRENRLVLTPLTELEGVGPGAEVLAVAKPLAVPCGPGLMGRVLNGLGRPMDDQGPIAVEREVPVDAKPPNALRRQRIADPLATGVRVLDALLTVGRGQRIGIFAGSGVGKSTFLSMIARNTAADLNVIALIGERGREVREFIERDLGEQGLARSVVVVATSDEPALLRTKAAFVATAVAEYFRDLGYHVNLMMDSLTRFAMAQREIGLSVGEPPTARGYTPSVFARLPRLLERTGPGERGTITAFYTVLVDGDDMNDPIADAVRGILDGHVVLSRSLAQKGQFPAVDVLASLSRLFPAVTDARHQRAAGTVREWLARYADVEDLLRIGAYQSGVDPVTDTAVAKLPEIRQFLMQTVDARCSFEESLAQLCALAGVDP